jgi:hypothetical protein
MGLAAVRGLGEIIFTRILYGLDRFFIDALKSTGPVGSGRAKSALSFLPSPAK